MLPLFPLLFILSQVRVHILEAHSTLHSTSTPFSMWDMLASSPAVYFVVWLHMPPLPSFSPSFQPQYLGIPI